MAQFAGFDDRLFQIPLELLDAALLVADYAVALFDCFIGGLDLFLEFLNLVLGAGELGLGDS
jgi:hypothetical protein